MSDDLSKKKCVPCESWMPPMKDEEIQKMLKQVSPEWRVTEKKRLVRTVEGKDFMEVVGWLNKIAAVAEEEGHHPNLRIHDYNKLSVELFTHKINGMHENDFILAAKVDEMVGE